VGRLDGKVAIVTGAGLGYGPGISQALAREGAGLAVVDLTIDAAKQVADAITELGGRALPLECDLSDVAQVGQMVAKGVDEFGRVDVLVNNGQRWGPENGTAPPVVSLEDLTDDWWDHSFEIGVKAAFLCSKAVFPHMRDRGGKIVNVGSDAGIRGGPRRAQYAPSSEALRALTKCTAYDWGRYGINVNVISPSSQSDPAAAPAPREDANGHRVITGAVTQNDVGSLAVFLASDATNYVTGQTFVVGGRVVI
jgi:NAD(P)-dependent dehydrogenase (short-subunit alcohol dehydrogenase family)